MGHRTKQTVEYKAFEKIASALDISPVDLIEAVGQTRSAITTAAKRGWVSKTTYLAAEGLLRRSRKKAISSSLFLVNVQNGKRDTFTQIMNGLEIETNEVIWDE